MAEFGVYSDPYVDLASVDLSAWVRSATLTLGVEANDDTAAGDTTRSEAAGLLIWTLEVEFNQDFAASAVDETLGPLLGSVIAVVYRPSSAAKAVGNPEYTGSGLLRAYNPGGGPVGSHMIATATISNASTLARSTSA